MHIPSKMKKKKTVKAKAETKTKQQPLANMYKNIEITDDDTTHKTALKKEVFLVTFIICIVQQHIRHWQSVGIKTGYFD